MSAKNLIGVQPELRNYLESIKNGLPMIRGKWFYVDPYGGSNSRDGSSIDNALASIDAAYDLCTSGAGDGIVVLSGGTTSANTTSYLKQKIAWSKHGITVVGVSAPTGLFGRARVANVQVKNVAGTTFSEAAHAINRTAGSFVTEGWVVGMTGYIANSGSNNGATFTVTAVEALSLTVSETLNVQNATACGSSVYTSYISELILLSGNNNVFYNLSFWNGGNQVGDLGGIKVTGARNYFGKCHIVGGAGCTATANERSLELGDGAQENVFERCIIGTDTVDRGNNANCELYINGTVANTARNQFENCVFLSQAEGGTAHLAIKSAAATSMGRHMIVKDCVFECYKSNLGSDQASMFGGTKFNTAKIILAGQCSAVGYAAWDSVGANDVVFLAGGAAAAATNGIGVAP